MRGAVKNPTLVLVGAKGADRSERLTALSPEVAALLPALRDIDGVHEAAVLATCHRTEFYLVVDPGGPWRQGFVPPLGVVHSGTLAAHHLLRVACGLESPILGDGQILGQVRRAYLAARAAGSTGPLLNKLFETALSAGKRVRQTSLGRGATTTASAAVQEAERLIGDLARRHVLVIGAGETAALAARHLARRRPASLVIANRSQTHAERVAASVSASAVTLDRLPEVLAASDLAISATARGAVVLSTDAIARAMAERPDRPLLAIDLAVAGDIEATAAEIPGVTRVGLDQVYAAAAAGLPTRLTSVPEAEAIAVERLQAFEEWIARREAVIQAPAVAAGRRGTMSFEFRT